MPTFQCDSCQKMIKVPDAYAGKRVRCPGCQQAQRVPEAEAAGNPMDSFAALDAGDSAAGIRRLREFLIGCGSCQKTIRLPTRAMGKTMTCPKCDATLKVDTFDLSKAKGDLVDLSHLELETANLLLDDTSSHGSTLGGSSIQLQGTGSGYGLNDTSMGSTVGGEATDSQSQMRELKALNELKHSGAISADEYKRRKSEIYSGRSLAIQAMSRSADGSGNTRRAAAGYQGSAIPGPVKMLIVVAVLGVGGFVLWDSVLKEMLQEGQDIATGVATSDAGGNTADASADEPETPAPTGSMFADVPDGEGDVEAEGTDSPSADIAGLDTAVNPTAASTDLPASDTTVVELPEDPGSSFDIETPAPVAVADIPPPMETPEAEAPVDPADVEIVVLNWSTGWPEHTPSPSLPITKACDMIKRIDMGGASADIGIAVGPPAEDLDDPAYEAFRREMQSVMTTAALQGGMSDQMNMREYGNAMKHRDFECHRLLFTFRNRRGDQVTILTGVQEGRGVAYWFVGSGKVYTQFLKTVGLAELGPKV